MTAVINAMNKFTMREDPSMTFINGHVVMPELVTNKILMIGPGSRLDVSRLDVQAPLYIQDGARLVVSGDLRVQRVMSLGNGSKVEIKGNASLADSLIMEFSSKILVEKDILTTQIRLGVKGEIIVKGKIETNTLAMYSNSTLVTNSLECKDSIKTNTNCMLEVHDTIKSKSLVLGELGEIKAGELVSSLLEVRQNSKAHFNRSVTLQKELLLGVDSILFIVSNLTSSNVKGETNSSLEIRGSLCVEQNVDLGGQTRLIVYKSLQAKRLIVGHRSIVNLNDSVIKTKSIRLMGSQLYTNGDIYVENDFWLKYQAYININGKLKVGGTLGVENDSNVFVKNDITVCILRLTSSRLFTPSCLFVNDEQYIQTIDEPSHESNGTVTIIEFPEVALSYNSSLEVGSKTLVNGVLIIGHSCTLTTKSLETNESIIMKTNSLTKDMKVITGNIDNTDSLIKAEEMIVCLKAKRHRIDIQGRIEVASLKYDMTNQRLVSIIDSLKEKGILNNESHS